mgnify:CR=1 FL=1
MNLSEFSLLAVFPFVYPYAVGIKLFLSVAFFFLYYAKLSFHPVGAAHGVDSSELAFKLAAIGAMREGKGLGG